ncbi:hypothetical protein DES40_2078 [Litorimonas taeanensis]|uniref:Outer membrane receptor protein involved in Fe transport n=1 Tax=Litorimonas taeanensis TaxID=568099 RepID=A0A420WE29_9PROT|nr:hypothetical protein [Litorimonas taeanensis]RKQ69279.1 hypothetical protein DES40_2078 [Litorimonas taeanensis]
MRNSSWLAGCNLALILSCYPNIVKAQTAPESNEVNVAAQSSISTQDAKESYTPQYFETFAPATAYDMVIRIPGFTLAGANFGRGLGQGGANVLINGERLTGKTDVGEQLSRIAAKNVVEIDIVDGASLNIPGLSGQVANITTKSTGISGTFEWTPEFRPRLEPNYLRGNVSLSGETGNLTYTLGLRNNAFRQGNYGLETLVDSNGTLFETRDEIGRDYGENPGATVDLTWKPQANHIANLNFEINQFTYDGRESSRRDAITPRGRDLVTYFKNSEDEWNMSIGGDYEFPLSIGSMDGKLKTIGYYRFESSPTVSQFEAFENDMRVFGDRFERQADEAETILRSEYSWSPKTGRDWQIGLEGAFNYLDIEAALSELEDGVYVARNLTGASDRVEEKRAEATLTHSRKLSDTLDVQASLGAEYSEISQSGNDGVVRNFIRPKGFISASYKAGANKLWRAKIERQVGQLNFFDFIASTDLNNKETRDSNSALKPSQTWRAEIAYERSFGTGNQWNTTLDGTIISDLVDRIPIGDSGNAIGNIDSPAYTYSLHSDITLKGENWDMKGVELNAGFGLHFSHVDDPVEGFDRRLSGDSLWHWNANIRHDIPKTDWAYGVNVSQERNARQYRVSTTQKYTFKGPFVSTFIEHKDVFGMRLNLQLSNLLKSSDDFEREIYTDRRDIGVLNFTESRKREFGMLLRANLSGTF